MKTRTPLQQRHHDAYMRSCINKRAKAEGLQGVKDRLTYIMLDNPEEAKAWYEGYVVGLATYHVIDDNQLDNLLERLSKMVKTV